MQVVATQSTVRERRALAPPAHLSKSRPDAARGRQGLAYAQWPSVTSLMIIHDLDIPGMPTPELKGNPPRSAGGDRPLIAAGTPQAVKTHRGQAGQVFESVRFVQ